MGSGGLDDRGWASGCWYVVPISCGGVVDGYVARLFAPLYEEANALGFFESLALALQETDQGVLVAEDGFVELFCGYVLGAATRRMRPSASSVMPLVRKSSRRAWAFIGRT